MNITETGPTIIDCEQGTEAWHEARRGILTASTIGALITPSKLELAGGETARSLMNQLIAERINGWTEPTFQSNDMLRGTLDEPKARALYAEHRGVEVREVGFMVRKFNGHRLGYSPDGLVGDDGLIEIKSRNPKRHLATILDDRVPAENMAQIQAGLLVSGRAWCDYISYCGGMRPYIIRVTPQPAWADVILAALAHFEAVASVATITYAARTDGLPDTERSYYDQDIEV